MSSRFEIPRFPSLCLGRTACSFHSDETAPITRPSEKQTFQSPPSFYFCFLVETNTETNDLRETENNEEGDARLGHFRNANITLSYRRRRCVSFERAGLIVLLSTRARQNVEAPHVLSNGSRVRPWSPLLYRSQGRSVVVC